MKFDWDEDKNGEKVHKIATCFSTSSIRDENYLYPGCVKHVTI